MKCSSKLTKYIEALWLNMTLKKDANRIYVALNTIFEGVSGYFTLLILKQGKLYFE